MLEWKAGQGRRTTPQYYSIFVGRLKKTPRSVTHVWAEGFCRLMTRKNDRKASPFVVISMMKGERILINDVGKHIYEQALDHLKKYLEVKDKILDNDFIQLAGDLSKVITFIRGANELIINKKFNSFLKGFTEDEIPTDEQMKKLVDYIDDESKAEFVSDTFTKILLSNSSKSCLIMGSLLKSLVEEGGNLNHSKLVCISALTNFYDVDLENFLAIFDFYNWKKSSGRFNSRKEYQNFLMDGLKKYSQEKNRDYTSLLLTIEKSINYQLIVRTYEADIDVEYDKDFDYTDVGRSDIDEYYSINSSGQLLYNYIKRIL